MAAAVYGESVFAYHGLDTRKPSPFDKSTTNGLAHVEQVKPLIKDFLENVGFDRHTPFIKDPELEEAVWDYFSNLNMDDQTKIAVKKALKLSVTLAHQAYTSLRFDIKVVCAAQILYMFLVDDIAEEFMEELKLFGQNFTLNNGHKHPLLNCFDAHLRGLSRYYGAYAHSAIIKSLFDYVNGRIIEHEMEQSDFRFPNDSRLMPMFLRTKVGAAEILIHMLWPKTQFPEEEYLIQYFPAIQEMVMFIDFTNDILSYYKEFVINDEKGNFVANFADTHGMTQLDVLKHLTSYTPQAIGSVYKMFQGKEDMLKRVQNFVNGWIMLCTAHRRYHLVELFEDEHYLPPYDEDS